MESKLTQGERIALLGIIYASQGSCDPRDIEKHFNTAVALAENAKAKTEEAVKTEDELPRDTRAKFMADAALLSHDYFLRGYSPEELYHELVRLALERPMKRII